MASTDLFAVSAAPALMNFTGKVAQVGGLAVVTVSSLYAAKWLLNGVATIVEEAPYFLSDKKKEVVVSDNQHPVLTLRERASNFGASVGKRGALVTLCLVGGVILKRTGTWLCSQETINTVESLLSGTASK